LGGVWCFAATAFIPELNALIDIELYGGWFFNCSDTYSKWAVSFRKYYIIKIVYLIIQSLLNSTFMKQLFSIAAAVLVCAGIFSFGACTSTSNAPAAVPVDSAGLKNLAASNAIDRAIESGDVSKLGDYIAADAVDHSGEHGDVVGLDSIKAELAPMHKLAANDLKFEVVKELADSDYVFQWVRMTGTATTTEMGVPVGSKFSIATVDVSRFKNGKATEHWDFMQPGDVMKMMAAPAVPASAPKKGK
jgi:predicted SnoaL-like aldol condensation-catalyzing enzyme